MEVHKLAGIYCVRDELRMNAIGKKKIKNTSIFTASVLCTISQLSMKAAFFFFSSPQGKLRKPLSCGMGWVGLQEAPGWDKPQGWDHGQH